MLLESNMNGIGLDHFLYLSLLVFTIGICGVVLNRKNIIVVLLSVELMLLAVNINMVAFSAAHEDLVGQVFSLFIFAIAAAEAAIGLAILVVYFRNRGSIEIDEINQLRG